jgi:hypothetical protein
MQDIHIYHKYWLVTHGSPLFSVFVVFPGLEGLNPERLNQDVGRKGRTQSFPAVRPGPETRRKRAGRFRGPGIDA